MWKPTHEPSTKEERMDIVKRVPQRRPSFSKRKYKILPVVESHYCSAGAAATSILLLFLGGPGRAHTESESGPPRENNKKTSFMGLEQSPFPPLHPCAKQRSLFCFGQLFTIVTTPMFGLASSF
ncbi:hypothetical protein AVEN_258330-1 [Araneus ventricosus]|uniref:Uncharacterized protein n=1 Tax=Araneus ventricosus TaxID=182803 RepID=A0A4Y2QPB9_ARAVE|nr:hypothetical protein AVEN_258330-1 [Araneus ventricosus]